MGMVELWSADYQKAQEAWAENEGVIGLAAMEGWTPPPKGAPLDYQGHTGANNYYTQNPYQNTQNPYQNQQMQSGYSGGGNDTNTGQYGDAPSIYDFG